MSIEFIPAHESRTAAIRIQAAPERAFPLFEPEGERAWASGWDPHWLYPRNGHAGEGGVFLTSAGGRETIWTITAHEPPERVRYSRITPGLHAVTVDVRLSAATSDESLAHVTYTLCSLTPAGNGAVAEMVASFDQWMMDWEQSINAVLAGGDGPDQRVATPR